MGKLRIQQNEGKSRESKRSYPSVNQETKLQSTHLVKSGNETCFLLSPFHINENTKHNEIIIPTKIIHCSNIVHQFHHNIEKILNYVGVRKY